MGIVPGSVRTRFRREQIEAIEAVVIKKYKLLLRQAKTRAEKIRLRTEMRREIDEQIQSLKSVDVKDSDSNV